MKLPFKFTVFFILILIGGGICPGQNDNTDVFNAQLTELLKKNAFPLRMQNGNLSGEGAKLLSSAMENVQFVALGEVHNKRSVHEFGGALFRLLHNQYGFNYLALEEDPFLGRLSSAAARKGGREAMIGLALRYPNAFHLLTEEELEMIGNIGQLSKAKTDPVWGLNQVFGAAHIYDRLVQIAPDKDARAVAQKLFENALEYEKERFQKNKTYVAEIARPADFEQLKNAFRPKPGSEADFLIGQIALSHQIFSPYVTKPRPAPMVFYQSNVARENNMKHLFAERYREAQAKGERMPKVLAMFGQLHLYRGLSEQTELFTLGNYLSELAIFNGKESFQIYTMIDDPSVRNSWHGAIIQAIENVGEKSDAGVLVDLRPLKALAIARNPESAKLNPSLKRLIMGFDVYLFLRDATTGSREKLKTPNFRLYPDGN